MLGEILIIIVGFFRWIINGFKNSLKDEIYGNKDKKLKNKYGNYLWGLVFVLIILIMLILFN
jgi:hypothetical protein